MDVLPEELIEQVLSWLSVKDLTRLKCVCKSWKLIISDSTFIKLHLLRSASRNPHLLLMFDPNVPYGYRGRNCTIVHFPVSRLIHNPAMSLPRDRRQWLKSDPSLTRYFTVVGSCNGLVCLHGYSRGENETRNDWLRFWNPATGLLTGKLGSHCTTAIYYQFTFGYDNSTNAFKIMFFDLGLHHDHEKRCDDVFPVRVFTLGCNVWRDLQNLPLFTFFDTIQKPNKGVNLRGTLNWLAYDKKYVILSLDLATEAHTQFLLPPDLGDWIFVGALMDCLCISYICKRTAHFVVWQMTEFGVENSWTQLLKISYQDLPMDPLNHRLHPLFLYNGDTLILACYGYSKAILYNMRDNRAKQTRLADQDIDWSSGMGYVESLFSPYGE